MAPSPRGLPSRRDRRELARVAPAGYASGPGAPAEATTRALARVGGARALVLVEGISDQIALDAAAAARSRDLGAERVAVVPIGGAHAVGRFLARTAPPGAGLRVAVLCDRREEAVVRRGLGRSPAGAEILGVYVCVDDLEDELIRAVGTTAIEALFEAHGDLASFRSFRNQPAWRGRELDAQMRRFLGSGARRKLRYAQLLARAAGERDALPPPLDALLTAVRPSPGGQEAPVETCTDRASHPRTPRT